jgi:D-sedoheptulose 7-phosphate isomerase
MKEHIISILRESADIKRQLAKEAVGDIIEIVETIQKALKNGKKILIFGNGGSAADSQHIAAEFINRYTIDRKALPAIALTTDTSVLTSIANDLSFTDVFSRQIEALANKGDLVWGITTSGKSPNVIKAFETASKMELKSIAFTGKNSGKLKNIVNHIIKVPSTSTQRIQESHITISHIICELVENKMFAQDN